MNATLQPYTRYRRKPPMRCHAQNTTTTTTTKQKKQRSRLQNKMLNYKFLENLTRKPPGKIAFAQRQSELQNLGSRVQFFCQAKLSSCDAR